jgi:hypothetical protein
MLQSAAPWVRNPLRARLQPGLAAKSAPRTLSPEPRAGPIPTWKPGFIPPASHEALPRVLRLATQLRRGQLHLPRTAHARRCSKAGSPRPRRFRFSFKAPQRITHFKRLRECEDDVANSSNCSNRCASRQARPAALPASTQLQGRCRPPRTFLAAPALQTNRTLHHRLRVPPRKLVHRRDRRHPPRTQRRALHRRKRRPRHARGHTAATTPASACAATAATPPELEAFAKRFTNARQTRDVYVYFKHEDEPTGALNAAALLACAQGERHAEARKPK